MTPADLARLAAVADRELALCATEAERVAARRMAWALVRAVSHLPGQNAPRQSPVVYTGADTTSAKR